MPKKIFLCVILSVVGVVSVFAQTKTITNADLEKYRQKRIQAEKEYRETYEKRGLPSPEELERREEEHKRWLSEEARKAETANSANADDFRARAFDLKMQISSVDAQIAFLQSQLNESSVYRGGTITISGYNAYPYGYGNFIYGNRPNYQSQTSVSNVEVVQSYGRSVPSATDIRNRANGNTQIYGGINYGYRRNHYRGYYVPVFIDTRNYTREETVLRLQSLMQTRAGLAAQYSALEEQARRAGVRID